MDKEQQLYRFMYTFYKQGNSLVNDKELKEEFNRSCFIEEVQKAV